MLTTPPPPAPGQGQRGIESGAGERAHQPELDRHRADCGRIGISSGYAGALVSADRDTALATIRGLDTMYVDLTRSSVDLLRLRKQSLASNSDTPQRDVNLEDGSTYPGASRSPVAVDESTGSVTLRAIFPTRSTSCCRGCSSRARIDEGIMNDAILAPQRGITRDAKGDARRWWSMPPAS